MHTMKEQLRLVWSKPTRKKARKFLGTWIMDAIEAAYNYKDRTDSDVLMPLKKLAMSLMAHMKGILNYFDYKLPTGGWRGLIIKLKH